jgi:hypothetical protein
MQISKTLLETLSRMSMTCAPQDTPSSKPGPLLGKLSRVLQYFGIQDAPRKRQPPVRAAGAWAGSTFTTTEKDVKQLVAQSKWDKAKSQILELSRMLEELGDGLLDYKRLEQIRGFLCHNSLTHAMVTPYLKGLHLMLASHHPGQDEFGWKMANKEWAAYLFESVENGKLTVDEAATMSRAAVEPSSLEVEDGESVGPPRAKDRQPLPTPPPKRIAPAVCLKMMPVLLARCSQQNYPPKSFFERPGCTRSCMDSQTRRDQDSAAPSWQMVVFATELEKGALTKTKHRIIGNSRMLSML